MKSTKVRIYDARLKIKKDLTDEIINIYNCGPTVYNHIHIGNARPLIVFDVLFRFLKQIDKKVTYLHNITDIDDKIIKQALLENKPELTISNEYLDQYNIVRKKLNTLDMRIEKVTDNIDGIIDYIQNLIRNGSAYENNNGNIYFNTAKVPNYGSLSNRKLDEQEIGERVQIDDEKINPTDFVLWKKTTDGIQWTAPWSKGRPGWHTECVYLIEKNFGKQLTIHGGGIDLKFPHHENENAQNQATHKCELAKFWMHVGHVNINNIKMSKSLNNFVLIKDILKDYDYQAVRWFFYSSNYRNPINYTREFLEIANSDIKKIQKNLSLVKTQLIINNALGESDLLIDEFTECLCDDLNIVNSIKVIKDNIKTMNIKLRASAFDDANILLFKIINCLKVLGVVFEDNHKENIDLIKKYDNYTKQKDFVNSDKIRDELIKKGLL